MSDPLMREIHDATVTPPPQDGRQIVAYLPKYEFWDVVAWDDYHCHQYFESFYKVHRYAVGEISHWMEATHPNE